MVSPIQFLREAIRAVPAVKYALGIGGIVATIAIVYSFKVDLRVAFVGTLVMLVLMTILVIFARMSSLAGPQLAAPTLVFTWFVLSLFVAVSLSLFTSVFFQRPLDLAYWLKPETPVGRISDDTRRGKWIGEYDFRLNEIETRDEEIRKAKTDDEKGALQVYIWRAVRGNSDFQPSLPEFANTHLAGIVLDLQGVGFTEHAKEAIQAARDLENGGPDAQTHQSPGGYGVFSQEYLDSRVRMLRTYSDYIHQK
jgi:hypothetical protein